MTTMALRPNYGINPRWVDAGTSPEAVSVAKLTRTAVSSLQRVDQRLPLDELDALQDEVRSGITDNVEQETVGVGRLFLLALPNWVPTPEVAVDPDGEISFDWFGKRGKNFSVSIRFDGRLSFAGQFGPKVSLHGTEEFVDSIPKSVLSAIAQLVDEPVPREEAA
ncbi:hypothetical protein [Dyella japonica]|uniref:Uncharacterized protein n=1 Tax=Dyella japonica DSM 16301 TaxID=1440762 RepID=A0A0G9GYU2_9GAMM|nr:hypothetical protein [Dyella japonica]KLD62498.1 hypothetical protein Y882_15720 [Dyella japonica DSM 16301]